MYHDYDRSNKYYGGDSSYYNTANSSHSDDSNQQHVSDIYANSYGGGSHQMHSSQATFHHNDQQKQYNSHFNFENLPVTSSSAFVGDSVIQKAQQKLEQATGFKLPKEFVKLGSQLVGGDLSDTSTSTASSSDSSSSHLGVFSNQRSAGGRNKSPEILPPIPSTQTLLANFCKQDPSNFTEEAWQTCKQSKNKLCDKLASYREKANSISSKELFWLRSSRPRWRRKVASADTSPEEPNRPIRFTRGLSEDSAQQRNARHSVRSNSTDDESSYTTPVSSFSFGENEDCTDVSQYSQHIHHLNNDFEDGDAASPPSPHGMYTWPPQHARHRHHNSNEDVSKQDKSSPSPSSPSVVDSPQHQYSSRQSSSHHNADTPNRSKSRESSLKEDLRNSQLASSRNIHNKYLSTFNSSSIGGLGSRESSLDYPEFKDNTNSKMKNRNLTSPSYHDENFNRDYKASERRANYAGGSSNFNSAKSPKNYSNDYLRGYLGNRTDSSSNYDNFMYKGRPQYPLPAYPSSSASGSSAGGYRLHYGRHTAMANYSGRERSFDSDDISTSDSSQSSSGRQLPQSTSHPDICFHNSTLSQDLRDTRSRPSARDMLEGHNVSDSRHSSTSHTAHHSTEYYHRPYSRTSSPSTSKIHQAYRDKYLDPYGNPKSSSSNSSPSRRGNQTLHYASSSINQSSSGLPSRYSLDGKSSEDLYVVHGIPPTIAGTGRSNLQSLARTLSFPSTLQTDSDPDYLDKTGCYDSHERFSSNYSDNLTGNRSVKDSSFLSEPVYETIPSVDKSISKYRYLSYSDRNDSNSYDDLPRGDYGFYDSGEFASRSSSTAYPIGPLGASWIQQGMHSSFTNRHSSGYSPSHLSSRHSPHPRMPTSPWSINPHHSSSPSLSSLDPSTDEFLVDAGIRIDESSLRSRLPTPQSSIFSSGSRTSFSSDYHTSSSSRVQRPLGGSRLRPPTPSSRIPGLTVDTLLAPRDCDQSSSSASGSSSRSRVSTGRGQRPVSTTEETCSTSAPPVTRTKSLSHENLRLSHRSTSPHMLPDPNDIQNDSSSARNLSAPRGHSSMGQQSSSNSSRSSRLPPRSSSKPTSCSSSPGASRCTSPGLPTTTPPSSRCSSPGTTSRIGRLGGGGPSSLDPSTMRSGMPQPSVNSVESISPTTPPSPAPQGRISSGLSSIGGGVSSLNSNRRNSSRLPLPTHRHRWMFGTDLWWLLILKFFRASSFINKLSTYIFVNKTTCSEEFQN